MKQVIDGKLYDTETAEKIEVFDNGLARSDFHSLSETLYKTKSGRFFLVGEGGALTRWFQPIGNGRGGGSGIQALSAGEALEWCETHRVDADVIAQHFDIEEG